MKHKIFFNKLTRRSLIKIGSILVRKARMNMQTISRGRSYYIRGRPHIASRWGDPANNLTRALTKTIRFVTRGRILEFGAGDNKINYVKILETKLNRPNIKVSIKQSKKKINKVIKKLMRGHLKWK